MKNKLVLASALAAVGFAHAVPQVSDVKISEGANGRYAISYAVDANAVVQVEVLTNGVPIGAWTVAEGVACGYVAAGSRSVVWDARGDLGRCRRLDATARVTAWTPGAAPDYLIVDLKTGAKRLYAATNDIPGGVGDTVYKTDKMILRRIPAAGAEFRMGQPVTGERCAADSGEEASAAARYDDETAHAVAFTSDFYMCIYEVTQRQYYHATGLLPSANRKGDKATQYEGSKAYPVENVSYEDLRGGVADGIDWPTTAANVLGTSGIRKFRDATGLSTLDLPTEAQWEFACRAGTTSALNSGKECANAKTSRADANAEDIAWYYGNANASGKATSTTGTREVGIKLPNEWGLYDMHGNTHEWCLDWLTRGDAYRATFAADWANGGVTVDPKGATGDANGWRVQRGGDYFYCSAYIRSAARSCQRCVPGYSHQHCGFRLICAGDLR